MQPLNFAHKLLLNKPLQAETPQSYTPNTMGFFKLLSQYIQVWDHHLACLKIFYIFENFNVVQCDSTGLMKKRYLDTKQSELILKCICKRPMSFFIGCRFAQYHNSNKFYTGMSLQKKYYTINKQTRPRKGRALELSLLDNASKQVIGCVISYLSQNVSL